MAEVLKVTSVVHPTGDLHAELSARADEVVRYIRTMPGACGFCIENAESDDPILPPVHNAWNGVPNCRCELVTTTLGEVLHIEV